MSSRANMNGEHTMHPNPRNHSQDPGPRNGHNHGQRQGHDPGHRHGHSENGHNHGHRHGHSDNGHNHDNDPGHRHGHSDNHHHHHQNHNQYYMKSSGASFKGCCCCLFLLLTFLGLLVLAAVLVIVLAVKPKKPQFDLQQVGVQYVGITAAPAVGPTMATTIPTTETTTTASLSLSIKMVFTAVNRNKVGIKYSESRFYVMYRGVPLGVATVPGFYQPAHSVRQVETTVAVDRVNLLQANAADLVKDAAINDRVELRIMGDVGAKIRILDFTSPRVQVSVDCAIVISPRKKSLTYKQCGVDGVNV